MTTVVIITACITAVAISSLVATYLCMFSSQISRRVNNNEETEES